MIKIILPLLALSPFLAAADQPVQEAPLNFATAWHRVVSRSPSLSAAYAQIGVQEAEYVQVSAYPNPLVAVVADNNSDCGDSHSWAPNTLTCSISQPVELGGKRCLRRDLATQMISFSTWDQESVKLDLYYRVAETFIAVIAAQESIAVYEKQLDVAKQVHQVTMDKLAENRLGILAQYKADVLIRTCNSALLKAERSFEMAKRELAALWGSDCPDFSKVAYPFYNIKEPPELCQLTHRLKQHPNITKWNYQIEAARVAVDLEKAQQIPDIVVTAGIRNEWWQRHSNPSILVGVAIPLPFFDRNQGNIDKARHLHCQAQSKQEELFLDMKTELIQYYEDWLNAYDAAECLKNTILPQAQLSLETAQSGYFAGKYEFYDVLDSQQTWFSTHQHYIESLLDYHRTKINIDRLTCYQEIYE